MKGALTMRGNGFAGFLIAAIMLAACSNGASDKAGGETLVLQLATIDSVNNNGQSFGPQAFVDALSEVSDGRLRVEVIEAYGEGRADAESQLIEAIATGDIDGGWPSTRAFASAGISGLEVVEAPMTITSYEAEKALVSSPVAEQLLSRLEDSGVFGLGMAVGPLRRPFAAEAPLLGLEDWAGTPFRVYNSPVQELALSAVDALPVNVGYTWLEDVNAGRLRGAEFDIAQANLIGLAAEAGNVTSNVVLWPKVFVLSISQQRFDALTDEQRDWVQDAARRATQASVDATYDETTPARELCDAGARFVEASETQIGELRAAFQPVIDDLGADSEDAALLEAIQRIASEHPGVEQPDVSTECTQGVATRVDPGEATDEISDIPEGTYRVELDLEDVANAGFTNEGGLTGTWTLVVERGTWALYCQPLDSPQDCGHTGSEVHDTPFEAGHLRGTNDTAHFVGDAELLASLNGCDSDDPCAADFSYMAEFTYVLSWVVEGDQLVFADAGSGDMPFEHLVTEPWTRID
jgi:TRAP-type C4-dicarboxylate transport system substrate-binding protein